jgi:anti-anti-sigma regulatory factor
MERQREPYDRRIEGRLAPALDDGLVDEPRLLADARLLAALHADLRRRHGEEGAARALLQAGFVHGLRDALRMRRVGAMGAPGAPPARAAACPAVAMRFAAAGAAHLRGSWPTQLEAEAVLVARGRPAAPSCLVSAGYTSGWVSGLWDADAVAVERHCAARGDRACEFEVRDAGIWESCGDPAARGLLEALPFGALRGAALSDPDEDERPSPARGGFDPLSPAIHLWGPVMVVPYAGEDTAVAVEAVTAEPAARDVTVVVVDLEGAIIDDGFGAVALERAVDAIEGHGAEAVLVGVSALSARAVAGLGRQPLVVRKDLSAAIALAFQIAESQRHGV